MTAAGIRRDRLGPLGAATDEVVDDLVGREALDRLWRRDHVLWSDDPTEISDRLGWLASPGEMAGAAEEIGGVVGGCQAERERGAEPALPRVPADLPLLQGERQHLLADEMQRHGWRCNRLDEAVGPQQQYRRGEQQTGVVGSEQGEVAARAGAPAGASEPLEQRCHRWRRVDLHHMVEVADVDAELERGGGHDHAVGRFGEGLLGLPSFVDAERAVGHEGGHVVGAEQRSQLLGPGPAVDEHETLGALVQA